MMSMLTAGHSSSDGDLGSNGQPVGFEEELIKDDVYPERRSEIRETGVGKELIGDPVFEDHKQRILYIHVATLDSQIHVPHT